MVKIYKDKIDITLKKLRNKIWIDNIIGCLIDSLLIYSLIILGFTIIIHVIPIVYFIKKYIIIGAILLGVGIIRGIIKRPSIKNTALIGDKMGLKDRLITYIEYKNNDASIINLFKDDLKETLDGFNVIKNYKIHIKFKRISISLLVIVLSLGIYFVPSSNKDIAIEKQNINKDIKQEAQNVANIKKEIKEKLDKENLDKKDKEIILSSLDNLEKKLNKADDYNQGSVDINDTQSELNEINESYMNYLSSVFDGVSQKHNGLKTSINSGNIDSIKQALTNEEFNQKEKNKMIDNIDKMKNSTNSEALNKIKDCLKKDDSSGKDIANILNKDKKKLKISKKADIKLESMKERMLSKEGEGFKSFGDKKGSDFVNGDNDELDNGENGFEKPNEMAMGNAGNKKMANSNGIGGNVDSSSDSNKKSQEGHIKRNEESTRLKDNCNQISSVSGVTGEDGVINNKYSDNVSEIKGDYKSLDSIEKEFSKEGMDYILKQDIPLEDRDLVTDYFKKLNGGD